MKIAAVIMVAIVLALLTGYQPRQGPLLLQNSPIMGYDGLSVSTTMPEYATQAATQRVDEIRTGAVQGALHGGRA